jgi:hypothetical protein
MTRQGGPKTLPAAFWQAVKGEAVAPAERRSGGPGGCGATVPTPPVRATRVPNVTDDRCRRRIRENRVFSGGIESRAVAIATVNVVAQRRGLPKWNASSQSSAAPCVTRDTRRKRSSQHGSRSAMSRRLSLIDWPGSLRTRRRRHRFDVVVETTEKGIDEERGADHRKGSPDADAYVGNVRGKRQEKHQREPESEHQYTCRAKSYGTVRFASQPKARTSLERRRIEFRRRNEPAFDHGKPLPVLHLPELAPVHHRHPEHSDGRRDHCENDRDDRSLLFQVDLPRGVSGALDLAPTAIVSPCALKQFTLPTALILLADGRLR